MAKFTASPPTKQDLRSLSQVRHIWSSLVTFCFGQKRNIPWLWTSLPVLPSALQGAFPSWGWLCAFGVTNLATGVGADSFLPALLGSRLFRCFWQFLKPRAVVWTRALGRGHPRYIHSDLLSLTHLPPPFKLIGTSYFLMEVPGPFRHFISFWKPATVSFRSLTAGRKIHKSYLVIRRIYFFFLQKGSSLFTPSAFHIYSESSWIAFVSTNMSSVF